MLVERTAAFAPDRLRALGPSEREAQVLSLAAEGGTNEDVARSLSVSPRTVKKHLESIYDKLGVHTRTPATAAAVHID